MTVGSILLAVALLILVCVFVLRPVLISQKAIPTETTRMTDKEQMVDLIRRLDLDFETGKIPEPDYLVERERLVTAAALALQQFDRGRDQATDSVDQQIEDAISERRRPNT